MTLRQDPDPLRAASHRHMAAHLTAAFRAGAVDTRLRIDADGRVRVRESRDPLLLVGPSAALGRARLRLRATVNPGGASIALPPLDYASYTEPGAFLPLHRPAVAAATRTAAAFTVGLELVRVGEDGAETTVAPAELAGQLEIRLLEGITGRILYMLAAEKQRLRREARELADMRRLAFARDNAVDRLGAELGVPRLSDEIRFDPGTREIVTDVRRDAAGAVVGEPDREYRRRLSLYRRYLVPNRRALLGLLNGPGLDTDPNAGPLRGLGLVQRFRVVEEDNQFSVAMHLVASPAGALREGFLSQVRRVHLMQPASDVPDHRFLPTGRRARENELRRRLRESFGFAADAAVAPALAVTLDRVARCRAALGVTRQIPVLRAQDPERGSRYELGLGADLQPQTAAELNRMAERLGQPGRPPEPDAEVEALLQAMAPAGADDDPEGRWLLAPCGLRTVHRLSGSRIYVSHLPTSGMVVSGPSTADPGTPARLEVLLQAPGDPGTNAVLLSGIEAAAAAWAALGRPAWTLLPGPQAQDRWDASVPTPAEASRVFRAAGLTPFENPGTVVERLKKLPEELLATLRLAGAQAAQIRAGAPAAAAQLAELVDLFRRHGLVALMPLVTQANQVLLVGSVVGLPEVGNNLTERRTTGFRWYVVPIQGKGGRIKPVGSRSVFVPDGPGLSAVVVIGYARRGATDPYEFRVELPAEARLSLPQYEFLMNLLDQAHPMGVEINTFSLRQRHVDLDGDGVAEALPPAIARTFRQFRRRRHRGEVGVPIEG
jgi:hypothetical protein